jgi:hypothetical protein
VRIVGSEVSQSVIQSVTITNTSAGNNRIDVRKPVDEVPCEAVVGFRRIMQQRRGNQKARHGEEDQHADILNEWIKRGRSSAAM